MDIKKVIELIEKMEADETIPESRFLTDGDEADFHPSVKVILDEFYDAPGAVQWNEMELAGYPLLPHGDCWTFRTKKGMINTGHVQ